MEEVDVLYRERFLRDRYGDDGPDGLGADSYDKTPPGGDSATLLDIIDAEIVEDEQPGPGQSEQGEP